MQQATRNYRMSDGTLEQTSDDLLNSAQRDAVPLLELGFDADDVTAIQDARAAFSAAPSDAFLMGAMVNATQAKNALRKDLSNQTRLITGLAKVEFGENSGTYIQFGTKELSKQNDNDFMRTCRDVLLATTTYAAQLVNQGITAPKIATYEALINNFDIAIDNQRKAIKNRDQAVVERITLGNTLYDLLVILAAKGKLCWIDINEALYNDYIIYTSGSGGGQIVEGDINGGGTVISTSIQDANSGTVLEITNTGNTPLTCFFASLPTDNSSPQSVIIPPNSSQSHPAQALGYSAQRPRFNIVNDAPSAGSYRVSWA